MAKNQYQSALDKSNAALDEMFAKWDAIDKKILETSKNAAKAVGKDFSSGLPKDLEERTRKNAKAVTYLNETLKEQKRLEDGLVKALAKKEAASSSYNKALIKQRYETQQLNKRAKESAVLSSKISTEYQKQSVKLIQLRREYKSLAIRQEVYNDLTAEQRKEMKRLGVEANKLDKSLKRVDKSVGQSQRNVGNYESGLGKLRGGIGQLNSLMAGFGVTLGASLFFDMLRESNELAKTLEGRSRRANIVFGESLDFVTKQAKENARVIGTTQSEYIGAAAAVADLLVPLGFQRDRSAELAAEVVNLSGALSDWVGGQYSSVEVSQIMNKAILGETEQLKQLGIVIDQSSKDFNNRIKQLEIEENLTREQARALDILNQITTKSLDAQTAFADGTASIAIQQERANAQARESKEAFAQAITPALIEGTQLYSFVLSDLSIRLNSVSEALDSNNTRSEKLAFGIKSLFGEATPLPPLLRRWMNETIGVGSASLDAAGNIVKQAQAAGQLGDTMNATSRARSKELELLDQEIEKKRKISEINLEISKLNTSLQDVNNREDAKVIQENIKNLEAERDAILGVSKATDNTNKKRAQTITFFEMMEGAAKDLQKELGKMFRNGIIDAETFSRQFDDLNKAIQQFKDAATTPIDLIDEEDLLISSAKIFPPEEAAKLRQDFDTLKKGLEGVDLLGAIIGDNQEFIGNLQSVLGEAGNLIGTFYDRNIQKIDDEINKNDEKYAKLLDNETLSNQQRNAIEAEQEAKRQALEKKKREEQAKQAKAEKAATAAQIVIQTSLAVISALAQVPKFDFGISAGAIAASYAALGAVQLATVLAQPIPQFKDGLFTDYEGKGIINDERGNNFREMVLRRTGKVEMFKDRNKQIDIKKGDRILPAMQTSDIINNAIASSMIDQEQKLAQAQINLQTDAEGIGREVAKQLKPLFKGMPKPSFTGATARDIGRETANAIRLNNLADKA